MELHSNQLAAAGVPEGGKAETTNEAASFGVTFAVALLVKLLAACALHMRLLMCTPHVCCLDGQSSIIRTTQNFTQMAPVTVNQFCLHLHCACRRELARSHLHEELHQS